MLDWITRNPTKILFPMKWATWVLTGATLLGGIFLNMTSGVGHTAPLPGDIVVEIEPVIHPRSPNALQAAKASTASSTASFPTFKSQQLDRQLRLYLDYLEKYGPPDILIVGSSRALQGIDPVVLQKQLAQQGYPDLKVFNFGINGATAQVVNWVLQRLLTVEHLPKLIVWGDGGRALNSGRFDHTFNNILQSDGQKLLASGIKPSPSSNNVKVGQLCMDFLPTALQARRSTPPIDYPAQVSPRLHNSPRSPQEICQQPIRITVRDPHPLPNSPNSSKTLLESFGFQLVSAQFSPPTYFQRYPKVSGLYDADYRNFTLNGTQTVALDSLARFANTRKIPLVFINLPLTTTYLDPARSAYEKQFRSRMQSFARSKQFTFKDFGLLSELRLDRYFADPSHLNQHGAAAVSRRIGQELSDLLPKVFWDRKNTSQMQSSLTPRLCRNACFLLPRIFA